jgi:hypothetical protein
MASCISMAICTGGRALAVSLNLTSTVAGLTGRGASLKPGRGFGRTRVSNVTAIGMPIAAEKAPRRYSQLAVAE